MPKESHKTCFLRTQSMLILVVKKLIEKVALSIQILNLAQVTTLSLKDVPLPFIFLKSVWGWGWEEIVPSNTHKSLESGSSFDFTLRGQSRVATQGAGQASLELRK